MDKENFYHVKIIVSSGFNAKIIKKFEEENIPVDVYGVGQSLSFIHTAARRTGTNVPIALYSLLNVSPDDGLMIVRNM